MATEDGNVSPNLEGISKTFYLREAERLLSGHLKIFGIDTDREGDSQDWNRDPLTGTVAPLSFGKWIDYRDESIVGNIKYLWEPNRHLELVTLAQAFALTGERRYLHGVGERIQSWLGQCPYPMGVNWASSLEVGIRLINWSLIWPLIGGRSSPLFAGEPGSVLLERWLDSIYQHVHFIRHFYSRFSSANNHLIGEAAGVFVATCTWPYWKDFEQWGNEARGILITEAESQTHPDGVNREQAISYQQFVLDFFVLSSLAGRARRIEFPREYWCTIENMMEFIRAVMDADGNVPMIGDADDGYVVRLSQDPKFCPFRSLLATGAILFNRADFAAKAGYLDDKTRFLLGEEQWAGLAEAKGCSADVRREFPHGGYYILGHDLDSASEIRLIADAGPLGYLAIAAHGHADALSFVLSVAGREILVDPGTYCYHTQPTWRAYFRGTGAHNTVKIDGQDQSVQGGNFMWLRHAKARCLEFGHEAGTSRFSGQHDGYTRLSDPVIHRRDILQQGYTIRVADRLECRSGHSIERCWHFSEQCTVSQVGSAVIAQHGPVRVTIRPEEPTTQVRVLRGSENPPGGWVSRRFDVKVPATSVQFLDEILSTTDLKTLIECHIGEAVVPDRGELRLGKSTES